jgi:NTE family protein
MKQRKIMSHQPIANSHHSLNNADCALMLPGGGARGAYQVGAIKAVWELAKSPSNPFPIITGTSAGAINAAVLASHAHEFPRGIQRLEHFWGSMYCGRIFRSTPAAAIGSAWRWLSSLALSGRFGRQPKSLLDNQPLATFLHHQFQSQGIRHAIEQGALRGAAVTASSYTSAQATTFFQAQDHIQPWHRTRRAGLADTINADHLLASAALPLLFPARAIEHEYYGDGGIRQTAPLSPAVHLGARKILIIGTRDEQETPTPEALPEYPGVGEIAGYMLDVIFMDNLHADLARLRRINRTLELLTPQQRQQTHLRPIHTLVLRPSQDLREIARRHAHHMPASVRYLLRSVGAWGQSMQLPSFLLFEAPFCRELIELGYSDTMNQRQAVLDFFAHTPATIDPGHDSIGLSNGVT